MQSIEELQQGNLLEQIASCSTSSAISTGDERMASIRGFQSVFKQVSRTPSVIRMLLQNEFHFKGQVDASDKSDDSYNEMDLLSKPWFSSTFVVPNFSNMTSWAQRCAIESEKGNTVVAVVPARTNTSWFHDYVLARAAEVRFIKGRLTFPGYKTQSPLPDLIAVYVPIAQRRQQQLQRGLSTAAPSRPVDVTQNNRAKVAIMTSFTGDETSMLLDTPDENENSEEGEALEEDNGTGHQPPARPKSMLYEKRRLRSRTK